MNTLARTWTMWIIRGIASLLFGVLTLLKPGASIAALVLVFGAYALCDGALLVGFGLRYDGAKAPYIVRGLLSVAVGVLALVYPAATALTLYLWVGAWAVAAGVAEIGIAFAIRQEMRDVNGLFLAGALSVATGVLLLALPAVGIVALLGLIAAFAIVNGIALIVAGVRIHRFFREFAAT
jgi:uncharacterized membrane protein HdeD (DUF308 family)